MESEIVVELRQILQPFIKEHPLKKDTVLDEDVEGLISFAQAFGVEREVLGYVKEHPEGPFWDFFTPIPPGVPPGQEDILEDDDE